MLPKNHVSNLGVYIHYPWCRKLCPYCDFPVAVWRGRQLPHEQYLDAVLRELGDQGARFEGRRLVSIYFGGGTPSLWPARCIGAAIAAVRERFDSDRLEITIEANPADCAATALAGWREAGVNRISIGVQSLADSDLVTLGRDHSAAEAREALATAQAAGFEAVSADLIFGTPGASAGDDVERSTFEVAALAPEHLSVYELTIEERTVFGKAVARGTMTPLDEDRMVAKYLAIREVLIERGYEHYEISSYARPGYRAVHNGLYWSGGEFLGLGCGAASFWLDGRGGGERWTNQRVARRYLEAGGDARVAERSVIAPAELERDAIWLGLRTSDGVPEGGFTSLPGLTEQLVGDGLAVRHEGRIQPTLRGFLYHDQVARLVVGS